MYSIPLVHDDIFVLTCLLYTTIHIPSCSLSSSQTLSLHRSHRQNLAPLLALQLGAHSTVDAGSDRVTSLVEQHAGVVVEFDDRAVSSLGRVSGSDNDGVADVAALNLVGGRETSHATRGGTSLFLDDDDDTVTYWGQLVVVSNREFKWFD